MASTPSGGASETSVQSFIHAIEQGRFVGVMQKILLGVGVLAVALAYLGWNFSGFSSPEAMDQAQVAREIARGHGFSTKFIRPLAIWQIEANKGSAPRGNLPDTFNAPLPPLVNSLAFLAAGDTMKFERGTYVAASERVIVILSMVCFLLAVALNYFLLARLFDQRLAFFASLAVLVSDILWKYTLSGLPQMLMLLLFTAALYALVRALQAHAAVDIEAEPGHSQRRTLIVTGWLAAVGLFAGLLTLCHGAAAWIAVGALGFSLVYFRRRGPVGLAILALFVAVYAPWMLRTYHVSGNPFGLAGYAIFDGINGSTSARMRSPQGPNISGIAPFFFRLKIEHGIADQLTKLTEGLGGNVLAVLFFVSLLHPFRRPETSALRWGVLAMWALMVFGGAILGVNREGGIGAAQLTVLFLPIMLGFGVAMALVLFGRLEASGRSLVRLGFMSTLLLISGYPMLVTLLPEQKPPHNFPPYFEPVIFALHDWTTEKEIIGSDMPWAVAFYADRKSLWMPNKLRDFLGMSDEGKLDGALAGLWLSPISRSAPLMTGILKGEYGEYAQLIFGNVNVPYFPFREMVLPSGDLNYSFYSDSRRWDRKKAE